MSDLGNKEIMAKNIRYHLDKSGKTRTEICNDLGISYSTFSDWINGNTYPRIDKIEIMANYFGIEKADLVEDGTKKQEQNYYLNDETRKIAQEIYDNKDLRILFDASRKAAPEDLKFIVEMAKRFKGE